MKAAVLFLALMILFWAWAAAEPLIYALTGFGFLWEYAP